MSLLRDDKTQDLTSVALEYTTTHASRWRLLWISFARDGSGGSDDFITRLMNKAGSDYELQIDKTNVDNDGKGILYFNLELEAGDEIRVKFPSQGGSGRAIHVTIMGQLI